ncbi:MAG: DUF4097 family beta strand repeat-containing protein [Betaproteobacteria bacterium]
MRYLVLAFAVSALAAPATRAAADTEHVSRTVPLAPGGTLQLKNFSGHVTITGTDEPQVVVEAVRRASREQLDRITLDVHADGSTVVVDANHKSDSWSNWARNNVVETDLDVRVPRRTNLDVHVFSSPIDIKDVDGSYQLHSFSAPIRLVSATGSVDAHTFSGSVDIRASEIADRQSIVIDTFSGSVDLRVPSDAHGTVRFRSFSGSVKSAIPLTLEGTASRRSLTARLGGGSDGASVRVKTFSGNLRINP